jgi:AbiV family abortive infection protein
MITYRKLSNMAILAFRNGLRLHFDSIILLENKSYPTATMLSVLAMEEFGKYFSLSTYVFYSRVNENRDAEFEKEFLLMQYNHPFKQKACFGRDGFGPSEKLREKVADRYFENLKQRSLYVGFDREKGDLLLNKKINNPDNINHKKAIKQIKFINNLLIGLVNDRINGIIVLDQDVINDLLTKDLLEQLEIKHYA